MPDTPLDKLKKITAWNIEPELTEDELEELLGGVSMSDAQGNSPTHEEWSPTYDLNAAAAAGWLIKAGRASELIEVDPPGSGIVTSKVFDNCRAMARIYTARRVTTIAV